MPFYIFAQNNSGGSFVRNDKVSEYVIIEANDYVDANKRAENIGIYFDGVESREDCGCCGDRWCPVDDNDRFDTLKEAMLYCYNYDFKIYTFKAEYDEQFHNELMKEIE